MKLKTLIIIYIFTAGMAYAQSQFSTAITKMETTILGVDYQKQNDKARIERLEKSVYGTIQNGKLEERVSKLSKDLCVEQMGKEIEPKRDTFDDDEPADSSVNYPIVNKLEEKVFKKTSPQIDIKSRVSRLEKQTFSRVFDEDLNTRVERLKNEIMPDRIAYDNEAEESSQRDFFANNSGDYNLFTPQNTRTPAPTGGAANIGLYIDDLEKGILKKNYQREPIENRITRMETKMFKTTFAEDDEQTRINRLTSAYQAQKSIPKYESDKFQRHLSTAIQVGAIVLMIIACIL